MPNHSVLAVANEFLQRHSGISIPAQLKLQKLNYLAHGWNLAISNQPLIDELPQAWDNGPVFRGLWNHIRDFGFGRGSGLLEDPFEHRPFRSDISDDEKLVIEHVWKKYGGFSGSELSAMTHQRDTPWFEAYFKAGRNSDIPNASTRSHYTGLAMAGRATA